MIEGPEHLEVFPDCKVASDSRAADRWKTTKGGVYIASGTTGPVAGRGADLFLVDDPQKSAADADSPQKRKCPSSMVASRCLFPPPPRLRSRVYRRAISS